MTMTSLLGNICWPAHPTNASAPAMMDNNLIDADEEYYGCGFQISPQDDGKSLDKVSWGTVTVTTGGDLEVRLESMNAAGDPSNSLVGVNRSATVAVASGDDDTWFTTTLTTAYTVTAGEVIAAIIERPEFSTFSGNLSSYRRCYSGSNLPYEVYNAGSNAKHEMIESLSPQPPCMAIHFSDGTFANIPPFFPFTAFGLDTWTSTGVERGMVFQVPVKMTIAGMWFNGGGSGTGADYRVTLYNSSGVPNHTGANRLANIAMDDEDSGSETIDPICIYFDTEVTLEADTTYRLCVDATSSNNFGMYYFDVDSATMMGAMPGGATWQYTLDDGAGGWTDTTTRRPHMGLIISQLDDGAGGGGGGGALLRHPGMAGGLVG